MTNKVAGGFSNSDNDKVLSFEEKAKRAGLDIHDPTVAKIIAAIAKGCEQIDQPAKGVDHIEEIRKQNVVNKQNPFFEEKVYDGRLKKTRKRTFEEQSPNFHLLEAARNGIVDIKGLCCYFLIIGLDRQEMNNAIGTIAELTNSAPKGLLQWDQAYRSNLLRILSKFSGTLPKSSPTPKKSDMKGRDKNKQSERPLQSQ